MYQKGLGSTFSLGRLTLTHNFSLECFSGQICKLLPTACPTGVLWQPQKLQSQGRTPQDPALLHEVHSRSCEERLPKTQTISPLCPGNLYNALFICKWLFAISFSALPTFYNISQKPRLKHTLNII